MVKGDVKVKIASTGKMVKAMIGLQISAKDMVITAKKSRAKLVMIDGNTINLSPKTRLKLSEYSFDKKSNKKNVLLNVLYGKVRSKVKQKYDGKKNKFRIKTPTAVAGVRGTDFITSYNKKTKISKVVTFEGRVTFGTLNKRGNFSNAVSIVAGQTSSVGSNGAAKSPTRVAVNVLNQMQTESDPDGHYNGPRVPAGEGQNKEQDKGQDGDKKSGPRVEGDFSMDDSREPASFDDAGMMPMLPEDLAVDDSNRTIIAPELEHTPIPQYIPPKIPVCHYCQENLQRTRLIINVTKQ